MSRGQWAIQAGTTMFFWDNAISFHVIIPRCVPRPVKVEDWHYVRELAAVGASNVAPLSGLRALVLALMLGWCFISFTMGAIHTSP